MSGDWLRELPEAERGGSPRNDRHYFVSRKRAFPFIAEFAGSARPSVGDFGVAAASPFIAVRPPVAAIASDVLQVWVSRRMGRNSPSPPSVRRREAVVNVAGSEYVDEKNSLRQS
ncbi:hypothetical protein FHX75_11291 [Micromonospora palomenae]|uniref:Uncharacterized protein n=1 Tax=Micromonospora palomenae TaxID=1461247 RepID=A0A561WTG7_9ACTN|nr:hypothetical protein [Micromonospora palomenae]TWG27156.1 hypothetical protein FHX75_11291 [Micromonospora palomenae]